jgi:hypothetical protein
LAAFESVLPWLWLAARAVASFGNVRFHSLPNWPMVANFFPKLTGLSHRRAVWIGLLRFGALMKKIMGRLGFSWVRAETT